MPMDPTEVDVQASTATATVTIKIDPADVVDAPDLRVANTAAINTAQATAEAYARALVRPGASFTYEVSAGNESCVVFTAVCPEADPEPEA